MGLMDKVKQQAEQAITKAQQGVAQGQAKLDEAQAKRQIDSLYRDLGAAYYTAERRGGPADDVTKALLAVDAHMSTNTAGGPATTATAGASSDAPEGDYTLGDI